MAAGNHAKLIWGDASRAPIDCLPPLCRCGARRGGRWFDAVGTCVGEDGRGAERSGSSHHVPHTCVCVCVHGYNQQMKKVGAALVLMDIAARFACCCRMRDSACCIC